MSLSSRLFLNFFKFAESLVAFVAQRCPSERQEFIGGFVRKQGANLKFFVIRAFWLIVRDVNVYWQKVYGNWFSDRYERQNPILRIPVQRMGASVDVNGTAKGLAIGSWST